MDIYQASVEIKGHLFKTLTPSSVNVLKADGSIGTIKIISAAFDGLSISQRLQKTIDAINAGNPMILKRFDLAFILVTLNEDADWTDYQELNEKPEDKEKLAAKDL